MPLFAEDHTNFLQVLLDKRGINVGGPNNYESKFNLRNLPLWAYAWENLNVENALAIIPKIPRQTPRMSHEEIAEQANAMLAHFRELRSDFTDVDTEWPRIKKAFIELGVPKQLLHD